MRWSWCVSIAMAWIGSVAHADPLVGATFQVGEALNDDARARVGSTIYVAQPMRDGWMLGAELSGTFEGYMGGYDCGTVDYDMPVPSLAVGCYQPSAALHALAGVQASPGPRSLLRAEVGLGGTMVFLIPGTGGTTQRELVLSGLLRLGYLHSIGAGLGADWRLGVAVEARAIGVRDTRLSRSLGLVLEAQSR
jgi:hypothetical protein